MSPSSSKHTADCFCSSWRRLLPGELYSAGESEHFLQSQQLSEAHSRLGRLGEHRYNSVNTHYPVLFLALCDVQPSISLCSDVCPKGLNCGTSSDRLSLSVSPEVQRLSRGSCSYTGTCSSCALIPPCATWSGAGKLQISQYLGQWQQCYRGECFWKILFKIPIPN